MNIVTTKLRILLFVTWILTVISLMILTLFFNFSFLKQWWFIIICFLFCAFGALLIDYFIPTQKKRDNNGNN
ncbi:hypothetical protein BUM85_07655 [Staphylococcus epidermidis]|nr:hypothetical protein BUM85_07655 [Staphylococcus epidermidis]